MKTENAGRARMWSEVKQSEAAVSNRVGSFIISMHALLKKNIPNRKKLKTYRKLKICKRGQAAVIP